MVNVKLYHERLVSTPTGSVMGSAGSIHDLNYDEAQYVVGMDDGEYTDPPPAFTSPPTLSKSTAVNGDLIRCYPGEFTGAAGGQFQWHNINGPIAGETTNSYAVRPADVGGYVDCEVTLRNLSGEVKATTEQCFVS